MVPIILKSGGFGGVFAPSLFMGACFGFLFATCLNYLLDLNLDTIAFTLVSMGAVLGGVNSIPISAILIIFEMTKDYSFMLPLMLSVIVSTTIVQLITKEDSVYLKSLRKQGFTITRGGEANILSSYLVTDVMVAVNPEFIKGNTPLPVLFKILLEGKQNNCYVLNNRDEFMGSVSVQELRPIITDYEKLKDILVARDIVNKNVIRVEETEDLDYVMRLFNDHGLDELPVVSKANEKRVVGVILRSDLMSLYNRELLKYNMADGMAKELKAIGKKQTSRVTEGYSIIEKLAPSSFVGKSLAQLRVRNDFGLQVLMIKRRFSSVLAAEKDFEIHMPSSDYIVKSGDVLVLFGADDKIAKTSGWD